MRIKKQQLEPDMEQLTGSKLGRLSIVTCLFNFYAEYIMRDAGLGEAQAGIKIAERNISNLRYADDTAIMAESKEELDEGERGEWKSWLKIEGRKVEAVTDFIFLGSKITVDGECSMKLKDAYSLEGKLWPT